MVSIVVKKEGKFNKKLNINENICSVNLNWDQKRIPNITANTDENPNVFKDQLLELTGVHPYRQKVILNGIALKDDYWNTTLQDVRIKYLIEFIF